MAVRHRYAPRKVNQQLSRIHQCTDKAARKLYTGVQAGDESGFSKAFSNTSAPRDI